MVSLPSGLADNLAEGLCEGTYGNCKSSLGYATFKNNTLAFKYLDCNKNYEKEFDEGSTKIFYDFVIINSV